MIKTKMAFLEGRLLSSQSEQFKKYSIRSEWLKKAGPPKKPLLFRSCKQAKCALKLLYIKIYKIAESTQPQRKLQKNFLE